MSSLLLLFLPKLLRGTRDRWVAQVSFIIIHSTGLAPFTRLSAPPHSSQMTFYQCLDSDSKIRLVDPNSMNILRIIHVHSGPLRYHHPDSKQCRPRSGPHLACMDFTRARCGLDLGQHYVAVWAVARVNMSVNIFHIPKKPCFFLKPFGRNHCVSTFESQLL